MPDNRIHGVVTRDGTSETIEKAVVELFRLDHEDLVPERDRKGAIQTAENGRFRFPDSHDPGHYAVRASAFGVTSEATELDVPTEQPEYDKPLNIDIPLGVGLAFHDYRRDTGRRTPSPYAVVGQEVVLTVEAPDPVKRRIRCTWPEDRFMRVIPLEGEMHAAIVTVREPGAIPVPVGITSDEGATTKVFMIFPCVEPVQTVKIAGGHLRVDGLEASGRVRVTMERTETHPTPDKILWEAIRERSEAISFGRYKDFIYRVLQPQADDFLSGGLSRRLRELGARGFGAYHTLREFTERFVLSESSSIENDAVFDQNADLNIRRRRPLSSKIEEELRHYLVHGELPYIDRVLKAADPRLGADGDGGLENLRSRVLRSPLFLELWHEMCLEHGMVMRTMEAISARFQNIYLRGENDGLSNYESSPAARPRRFFLGLDQQRDDAAESEAPGPGIRT
jgi:hypothetical protein